MSEDATGAAPLLLCGAQAGGAGPLHRQCSGITREGRRCARSADGPNGLCWLHDPTRSDDRRRAASKAGKSKPNRELIDIKCAIRDIIEGVLDGSIERPVGGVAFQGYNTLLKAVSTELAVQERLELIERLEALEASLEARAGQERRWG